MLLTAHAHIGTDVRFIGADSPVKRQRDGVSGAAIL